MATGLECLPQDSRQALTERVSRFWDFSSDYPIPRQEVDCPVCHTGDVQIRRFHFFRRGRSYNPFRCDVHWKCRRCSVVWTCGVVVPESLYRRHCQLDRSVSYTWRYVREQLRGIPDPEQQEPMVGPSYKDLFERYFSGGNLAYGPPQQRQEYDSEGITRAIAQHRLA